MSQNNLNQLFSLITEFRRKNALIMSLKLKEYDLTYEQWVVLKTIKNNDYPTPKVVADLTNKDKSTLTRILDQLEQKNMVERQINHEDRRSIVLAETSKGSKIVKEILPVEDEVRARIRDGISEEEITRVNSVFMKMLENLEDIIRGI